jgi:hypothetical protein
MKKYEDDDDDDENNDPIIGKEGMKKLWSYVGIGAHIAMVILFLVGVVLIATISLIGVWHDSNQNVRIHGNLTVEKHTTFAGDVVAGDNVISTSDMISGANIVSTGNIVSGGDLLLTTAHAVKVGGVVAISYSPSYGTVQFGDPSNTFATYMSRFEHLFFVGTPISNTVPGYNNLIMRVGVDTGAGLVTGANFFSYNGFYISSDRNVKRDIRNCSESAIVNRLNSISLKDYSYTEEYVNSTGCTECAGNRTGFIAQELKDVYPIAVKEMHPFNSTSSSYTVNYAIILPELVGGFQYNHKKIKKLRLHNTILKEQISNLNTTIISLQLENVNLLARFELLLNMLNITIPLNQNTNTSS